MFKEGATKPSDDVIDWSASWPRLFKHHIVRNVYSDWGRCYWWQCFSLWEGKEGEDEEDMEVKGVENEEEKGGNKMKTYK